MITVMKSLLLLLIYAHLLLILSCSSSSHTHPLTVKTNIKTSLSAENPSVVDPADTIILEFSEPLDMNTAEGKISLHAVKTGGLTVPFEVSLEIVSNAQKPKELMVRIKNGAYLPSGEEYKLIVSREIRSLKGNTMSQDFIGYFATDYNFTYGPENIPELGDSRTIVVIISDIHMGDMRSKNSGYGWFNKNSAMLVGFLNLIRQMPNVRELVIAGDLFDEWVAPMESDTFNGVSQPEFVDMIVAANKPVVDTLNNIIKDSDIKVTYIPGNHDMLVGSADIQRIFPGISEARDNVQGLGTYTPMDRPEIIIEHGHRYDFFNAPDPISNRSITNNDSITPPGFFVSKIATTSDMERGKSIFYRQQLADSVGDQYQYYLPYWAAWELIMSQKTVKESWASKIIKTGIDGYADTYAIDDLIPYHSSSDGPLDVNLYKGILDTWYDRQAKNNVSVPISADMAIAAGAFNPVLDSQSAAQYFSNPSSNKRIVVFGHTHHAIILSDILNHNSQWSVYANTGTWIDSGDPSCTFVAIIPQKDATASTETVTVYQYADDNNINKLHSAVIIN
jgi:UDP-2,3-diacylglucosamine pyrophosphatase LpxH